MCRNHSPAFFQTQRGFSLVLALFIIIICGLLATALINTNSINADSVAREVLSTRALLAAESGAQRSVQQILSANSCVATPNWSPAPDCSVAVSCKPVTAQSKSYFTVVATGRCGPSGDDAQRAIEVMVSQYP